MFRHVARANAYRRTAIHHSKLFYAFLRRMSLLDQAPRQLERCKCWDIKRMESVTKPCSPLWCRTFLVEWLLWISLILAFAVVFSNSMFIYSFPHMKEEEDNIHLWHMNQVNISKIRIGHGCRTRVVTSNVFQENHVQKTLTRHGQRTIWRMADGRKEPWTSNASTSASDEFSERQTILCRTRTSVQYVYDIRCHPWMYTHM
jgi:hypothetical protein